MRCRNLLLSNPLRIIAIVVGNYRTHPEQEVGQINVTADAADAEIRSILAAHRVLDSRKATRTRALAARDVACRKVQQRLDETVTRLKAAAKIRRSA